MLKFLGGGLRLFKGLCLFQTLEYVLKVEVVKGFYNMGTVNRLILSNVCKNTISYWHLIEAEM